MGAMNFQRSQNAIRRATLSCAGIVLALLIPTPGRADLVITALPATATSPSTGNVFDVVLQNTGLSAVQISAFNFDVTTADTSISFISASSSTADPYIFATNSLGLLSTGGPQDLDVSDFADLGVGDTTLASGATVGLGRVSFNVAGGATPGSFAVNLAPFPGTFLTDENFNNPPDTLVAGQITIQAPPVPEPAGLSLLPMALLFGAVWAKRGALSRMHRGDL